MDENCGKEHFFFAVTSMPKLHKGAFVGNARDEAFAVVPGCLISFWKGRDPMVSDGLGLALHRPTPKNYAKILHSFYLIIPEVRHLFGPPTRTVDNIMFLDDFG